MATRRIQRTARTTKKTAAASKGASNRPAVKAVRVETRSKSTPTWPTVILVIGAIILAFGLYLVFHAPVTDSEATTQTQQVDYQGIEGKTALDILKTKATVETKNYDGIGELVTSINGIPSTADHFWIFYINGEQGQVGAGAFVTKATDQISWRFEAAQ